MSSPFGHRGMPSGRRWGVGWPRVLSGMAAIPAWSAHV